MLKLVDQYGFLYSQLVKRDFNKKYKRSILGVFWSILSPLLTFFVMFFVFTHFFGRDTPHYSVYLFSGLVVFGYFTEATNSGMNSFVSGAGLYSKLRVPKLIFIATSNTLAFINFFLTFVVLLIFIARDDLLTWKLLYLIYPTICITFFNVGVSLILGTFYVFFKDIKYLYSVATRLLRYVSALFYTIDSYPDKIQSLFYFNPIFVYISYFREIIIYHQVPSQMVHELCLIYAVTSLLAGVVLYGKFQEKFIYFV